MAKNSALPLLLLGGGIAVLALAGSKKSGKANNGGQIPKGTEPPKCPDGYRFDITTNSCVLISPTPEDVKPGPQPAPVPPAPPPRPTPTPTPVPIPDLPDVQPAPRPTPTPPPAPTPPPTPPPSPNEPDQNGKQTVGPDPASPYYSILKPCHEAAKKYYSGAYNIKKQSFLRTPDIINLQEELRTRTAPSFTEYAVLGAQYLMPLCNWDVLLQIPESEWPLSLQQVWFSIRKAAIEIYQEQPPYTGLVTDFECKNPEIFDPDEFQRYVNQMIMSIREVTTNPIQITGEILQTAIPNCPIYPNPPQNAAQLAVYIDTLAIVMERLGQIGLLTPEGEEDVRKTIQPWVDQNDDLLSGRLPQKEVQPAKRAPDGDVICPKGTFYNKNTNTCWPDKYRCPTGYYYNFKTQTCRPIGK